MRLLHVPHTDCAGGPTTGRPQAGWLLPAPPRPASPKASPPHAPSVTMPLGSGMAGVGARRRAAAVGGAPRLARRCPEGATGRKDVVGPPGLRVPAVGPTVAGRWERDRAWAWVRATKRVLGAWCGCPRGCGVVQGAGSWSMGRMCKGECVTLPDPTGSLREGAGTQGGGDGWMVGWERGKRVRRKSIAQCCTREAVRDTAG